jgi:hypothetical protein
MLVNESMGGALEGVTVAAVAAEVGEQKHGKRTGNGVATTAKQQQGWWHTCKPR